MLQPLPSRIPSATLQAPNVHRRIVICFSTSHEALAPFRHLHVRAFRLVENPTMPSADFCCRIRTPYDARSTLARQQISPGNAHSPSRLCPPHLRRIFPYRYRTLKILASSSRRAASYAISVRQASDLPAASFRSHLAMDTLAVRLTVPPVGSVGDFHPRVSAPGRAHKNKGR